MPESKDLSELSDEALDRTSLEGAYVCYVNCVYSTSPE